MVQCQRLASLLTVLAQNGHERMVIQKIDGSEEEIVLHGVCLGHDLPDTLAGAGASGRLTGLASPIG